MEAQIELQPGRFAPVSLKQQTFSSCELRLVPSIEQLAWAWREIIAGRARVVAAHSNTTHHHIELTPTRARALTTRELERWIPMLSGNSQKVVATNIGCSNSTVATSAAHCLKSIGLNCTARDAPILLVMMAHASEVLGHLNPNHGSYRLRCPVVFSVARPDAALAATLSRSELEVVRLRVDGLSHSKIATLRLTSSRTVANQLASVYGKLGVSGRLELLASLVKGTWRSHERTQLPRTKESSAA